MSHHRPSADWVRGLEQQAPPPPHSAGPAAAANVMEAKGVLLSALMPHIGDANKARVADQVATITDPEKMDQLAIRITEAYMHQRDRDLTANIQELLPVIAGAVGWGRPRAASRVRQGSQRCHGHHAHLWRAHSPHRRAL
jgi:hypothetical protein